MFIRIGADDAMSLEEAQDFRGFSIVTEGARRTMPARFHRMASDAGDGRWWLDADAVIALSGHAGDADWIRAFEAMLKGAEPYGFADLATRRVKAHVEPRD